LGGGSCGLTQKVLSIMMRLFTLLIISLYFQSCAYYFGNHRIIRTAKDEAVYFEGRKPDTAKTNDEWQKHPIIAEWASKKLELDWEKRGKTDIPRILLAKLALNQDIDSFINYLSVIEPWGKSGTDWLLHPNGDYDFSEIIIVNLLYLFGNEINQKTQVHILNVLLTEQKAKPFPKTPNTLGLMRETENHILMKESVRYLRRVWIAKHFKKDDKKLKKEIALLEKWMLRHLEELNSYGMWEYNSIPYLGYAFVPLLTLESHAASEAIRTKARQILDKLNYFYALGSLNFKRSVPFRRQMRRFGHSDLSSDPHTSLMLCWYYLQKGEAISSEISPHRTHQSLLALLLNYRLPDEIIHILEDKDSSEQFFHIGHGWLSSPELHWKSNNALLSGGGVQRGKISQLVPRPIVLMLNDTAKNVSECFHIKGGNKAAELNNTGIYKSLAVGKGSVSIPEWAESIKKKEGWSLYKTSFAKDFVIVFSKEDFGLIYYVSNSENPLSVFEGIVKQNKYPIKEFYYPNGDIIQYDIHAPKNKWVMKILNNKSFDRRFDRWNGLKFYQ
jgi:hypothetical protein